MSNTEGPAWPSAAVAIALLALIGTVGVTSIIVFSNVDDALRIWSALAGLLGVVTGAFVSYFFTRGTMQQVQQIAANANQQASIAQQQASTAQQQVSTAQLETSAAKERTASVEATAKRAVQAILPRLPAEATAELRVHPDVQSVLNMPGATQ